MTSLPAEQVGGALPFGAVSEGDIDLGMMPLERYAELTVALGQTADRHAVLRRFVLTEEVWKALAHAWGKRLLSNPAERALFDQQVDRLKRHDR
jgi:hypothetical protein